jgi:hypothetical protein
MRYSLFFLFALAVAAFSCEDAAPGKDALTMPQDDVASAPQTDTMKTATAPGSDVSSEAFIRPGKYKVSPGTTKYEERVDFFTNNTGNWYARDVGGQLREEINFNWNFSNGVMTFSERMHHVVKPNEWKPEWTSLPDERYNVTEITDSSFTMTLAGTTNTSTYVRIAAPGKATGR